MNLSSGFFLFFVFLPMYIPKYGFPGSTRVKNLPASGGDTRDVDSIPWLERSRGEGNGNLLQYSFMENSVDRESWPTAVHGDRKNQA